MPLRSPSTIRCSSRRSTGPARPVLVRPPALEADDALEDREQLGQRVVAVGAAVVDEVEADLPGPLVDLGQGQDLGGVHDGGVEAGLHALVEEDRVEDLAGGRVEAERHVGQAEDGVDAGQLGLDPADALDGLDAVAAALLHAGRQGEGQGVEQEVLGVAGRSARRRCRGWPWPPAPSSRPCGPGPPRRCRCRRRRRRTPWPGSGTSRGGCPASSPSSRLTELMTARPPIHDRAVSTTGASVESTISGTVDWVANREATCLHVGHAVGAGVVDAHVDDVGRPP